MGKLRIVEGDILDFDKGLICHQVNCLGIAGGGLALQIRKKYPEWYEWYAIRAEASMLGQVNYYTVHKGLLIANLHSQLKIGPGNQTNYTAIDSCLHHIWVDWHYKGFADIYIPYGIGCGIAGGDWSIVEPMIERILPMATIVKLPEKEVVGDNDN